MKKQINQIDKLENINMIRKLAWSFHKTTGLDVEELISEATVAYYSCVSNYKPEKGTKLITYAYRSVSNALCDYCRNELNHKYTELGDIDISYSKSDFDIPTLFPGGVSRALVDAVISMANTYGVLRRNNGKSVVTDTPIDFLLPPKKIRGQIINELRNRGWGWVEIWKGVREVKAILSQN